MKTQLTATAVMSDNSHKDVTSQVAWASSNPTAATISNSGGSIGLATALSIGTTTVSASGSGVVGQTKLAVTAASLTSIEITPPSASAANGTSVQFTATGVFSDHSKRDLTSQVTWISTDASVAMIGSGAGSSGVATGTGIGSVGISASLNGVASPSATLTVTAATLVSINVTPPSSGLPQGLTQQFTATGVYSDNSTQDITSMVAWLSSDSSVASMSNTPGSAGLASAIAPGVASISASLGSVTSLSANLTVTRATLTGIQVTAPSASLANGLTQQFTATGVYSDKSTQDLTAVVTWSSSDSAVATVSNAVGANGLATALTVGSTAIVASSGLVVSPAATLTVTPAELVSIQVTPPNPSIASGLTQQFLATGLYTDNSTHDVTQAVTWASSSPGVASISNASSSGGLASAATVGSTNISATLGGVTSPAVALGVTAATLTAIQITPPSPAIAQGLSEQFTATGIYSDNSTQDLTPLLTWSSSDTTVATVSSAPGSGGLAFAAGVGSAKIIATYNGVSSPAAVLTVTSATLVAIQLTPAAPSIANGLTQQFTATGLYTDNSTQDLTSTATWSSSDGTVATISNASGSAGLATARAVGTAAISASYGGIASPAVSLTVTAATLSAIQVTPPASSIANGLTQQFTAMGLYTDNSTQDLTAMVTWASSDSSVASISNAAGSSGLASASGVGTSNISASLDGVSSPPAALAVTAATLVAIQVTPPAPSVANGLTQQFTATGIYTDNSTQDLTTAVTWLSSNGTVATISNAAGSSGLASASSVGTSNISASLDGVSSPAAALTVTAATLVAIQVTPPAPGIANGLTQQFTATGIYTDNSTQDLTAVVTWVSSNGTVATISNAAGSSGLASALSVGMSNISAGLNGIISPTVALTVTPATLASIQVTPSAPSIPNGLTQQFAATGTYTDNTTQDLTTVATWASSASGVASISNAAGSQGVATGSAPGSTNISAAYSGVISPAASLTVTAATVVSIQVSPSSATIANGSTEPYDAVGTYTDNSTQDLTTVATWTSSNSAVATISNAAGSNGVATAAALGSTNISAIFNSVTSPVATLTVVAPLPGVAGIWTATPAAGETAGMISDGAGNFFFFDSTATCFGLYNGILTVSGSTISGSGNFAPSVFGPNSGCPAAAHENYSGSLVPGVSMTLTGTASGGGGTSPTFNFTFSSIYNQPSAVALVAGTWLMPGGSVATISSTGAIAGTDASTGCTITGHVSVSNTSVNVYNVSVTYSGCTGAPAVLNGIALNGLGTLDTSQTPAQFDVGVRSANKKIESVFFWTQQ